MVRVSRVRRHRDWVCAAVVTSLVMEHKKRDYTVNQARFGWIYSDYVTNDLCRCMAVTDDIKRKWMFCWPFARLERPIGCELC